MDISTLNTKALLDLVDLIQRKEKLETELAQVNERIGRAFGGSAPKAPKTIRRRRKKGRKPGRPAKAAPAAKKKTAAGAKATAATKAPKAKGKRGALKSAILRTLKKAGSQGLSAKELSDKLKVPNQNIHVWFSSTGKNVQGLKKSPDKRWSYSG